MENKFDKLLKQQGKHIRPFELAVFLTNMV